MDPVLRTSLVIAAVVAIKGVIFAWWGRFQARKALEPLPMKLRNGVYIPWGPVQQIRHYGWRLTQLWLAYMALLIVALAAMWAGLWNGF